MNINYTSIYKLLIFVLVLSAGCKKDDTFSIIPPDQFADIYLELNINSETDLTKDSTVSGQEANFILSTILKKYNFTENDFKYTIEVYNKDITKWKEFYENVIIKLEKLHATMN